MRTVERITHWLRRHRGKAPLTVPRGAEGKKVLVDVDPTMLAYLNSPATQPTQLALDSLMDN